MTAKGRGERRGERPANGVDGQKTGERGIRA
jgi:hypothetical protein